MKIKSTVIFVLQSLFVFTQNPTLSDSLATHKLEEIYSSKVYQNRIAAKKVLDSLHIISERNQYLKAVFYYHFLSGDYYFKTHDLPLSESNYQQALEIAKKLQLNQETADCLNWLGNLSYFKNNYNQAVIYYKEAYAISQEVAYIDGIGTALFGLSALESDHKEMMQRYISIDSLYAQHNLQSAILGNTYEKMGNLYLNSYNNKEKALLHYEKSLSVYRNVNFSYGINHISKLLGQLALKEGDYQTAQAYFDELYQENIKNGDTLNQMHALIELAEIDRRLKKYNEAENKILKVIDVYRKKNDSTALLGAHLMLAQVYLDAKKTEASKPYLDYTEKYYKNSLDTLAFNIQRLSVTAEYYTQLNDYKKVAEILTIRAEKRELQNKLQNQNQLFEVETRYRTAQKEQQIELLSAENELATQKRKNQLILFSVLVALILIIGSSILVLYRNKIKTAQKIKELNTMKSRFFANISHEIRTPLTLIKGSLQNLKSEIKDENQQKQIKLINRNSDRLLDLVDQLLELSKLDSGNLKLILKEGNLGTFLISVAEPFEFLAKAKHLNFSYQIEKSNENHLFDKDVIQKIVTNLLTNAVKYTPVGFPFLVRF